MKINLPEDVKFIIESLKREGFESYAVGGCVRDTLLGRKPDDWDITTNAKPAQIKKVFRRTVDTGIEHGTVTVLIGSNMYEVTTYRIDGEYEDNRHPKQVEFTSNLKEDLRRRDFTINAMAYNDEVGIVDEYNGMEDLKNGIIRCVGEATERFDEDALRIMRAIRFAAQLGYSIEEKTMEAIRKMCTNLQSISAERINIELTKLIVSPNPGMLRIAYESGVLDVILPELAGLMTVEQNNPHHCYTVGEHIIHSVEEVEADRILRYTMLFHDLGKGSVKYTTDDGIDHFHGHAQVSTQMAHNIMKRLHFDNDTLKVVEKLVQYHDLKIETDEVHVRKAMNLLGEGMFPMLMKVKSADFMAQSNYHREEKQAEVDKQNVIYQTVIDKAQCVSIKDLAVKGSDLIECGIKPGPEIGSILSKMLEEVIEHPENNNKEYLMRAYSENN